MRTKAGTTFFIAVGIIIFILAGCSKSSKDQVTTMQRYENGWPTFWISYPTDWIRIPQQIRGQIFNAAAPTGMPNLKVSVNMRPPAMLKYFSRAMLQRIGTLGTNFDIIKDKAVTLKDGREAWETRINWDPKNGPSLSTLFLTTKKEDMWIIASISTEKGNLTNKLKAIPYSLEVLSDKELPIALPEDIDRFVKEFSSAMTEHNLEKVMSFYSDNYKNRSTGATKADVEQNTKTLLNDLSSFEFVATKYRSDLNKAYIAGYMYVSGFKVFDAGIYLARNDDGQWVIVEQG